jgi:hypothetical protein
MTYGDSQEGDEMVHANPAPLQSAWPPFAQSENWVQQPDAAQSQLPGSTYTAWQLVSAAHSAAVVA